MSCGEGDTVEGNIWVVEQGEMEQKVQIDASAIGDALDKTGRIALYGITFAIGKADLGAGRAKNRRVELSKI